MAVGIINIGLGNLGSIGNVLSKNNIRSEYIDKPNDVKSYEKIILPGVGSFSSFYKKLENNGFLESLNNFVNDKDHTLIGICVGMQIMFESGDEGGGSTGLNLVSGKVSKLSNGVNGRVPNVGWSEVKFNNEMAIFNGSYY